jgi:hypothetical protein
MTGPKALGTTQAHTDDDGTILRLTALSQSRDDARRHITVLRYEVEADGVRTATDRPWLLHWYTQADFATLAEVAGLTTTTAAFAADGSPPTLTRRRSRSCSPGRTTDPQSRSGSPGFSVGRRDHSYQRRLDTGEGKVGETVSVGGGGEGHIAHVHGQRRPGRSSKRRHGAQQ